MPPGKKRAAPAGGKPQGSCTKDRRTATKTDVENSRKTNLYDCNLKSQDSCDESHSESSSSSRGDGSSDPSSALAIRRPTYWLEMRGIKSSDNSLSGTEGPKAKKKRLCKGKAVDYEMLDGNETAPGEKQSSKPKARSVRKDPPSYPAGSVEESWYLEILDRGRITCPTCRCVSRKTVEGLKKHMSTCKEVSFTCQHCGKVLGSAPGMKYHIVAEHSNMPVVADGEDFNSPSQRRQLRKLLRQLGKLKCTREGCVGSFTSVVGYLYHVKKCGKKGAELEKMELKCHHCGKVYRSRAGLVYHQKSEHTPVSYGHDDGRHCEGRAQRRSAKVAIYHLQQIATEELIKEWPKRKVLEDLVPQDGKLKFSRPGLPTFSQEVIRKWRVEMKASRRIRCPNKGCESAYTSISGLKAHLGSCTQGDFVAGKYKCLICDKEFGSESGVKYHINCIHSEEWFVVSPKSTKSFEQMMKMERQNDKKVKKKKRAVPGGKKKGTSKKNTAPVKEPRLPIGISRSERTRNMPSESESESRVSSHSSLEEEIQSMIWRARQPIVKPASLKPAKTAGLRAGPVKEAQSKTTELKPGFIKEESVLSPVLTKTATMKPGPIRAAEFKPGLDKTTSLKQGLIKAAVLKLDRRRK